MLKAPRRAMRRLLTPAARALRKTVLPRVFPAAAGHCLPDPLREIRVVGLLSSASGLGKSARLCAKVLSQSGYRVSGANVAKLYQSDDGLPPGEFTGDASRTEASIYHLNPPMLVPGIIRANPVRFWRGYNIGYWAWELEVLPREWIAAMDLVDAVLVPSTFCRRAVQQHTDKPVVVVPHPLTIDDAEICDEKPRHDGLFRVISVFNFGSSFERKNPVASIRAFRQAFGNDASAELVLKVGDGDRYPADRQKLVEAIGDSKNIRLVDEIWDEGRLARFINSADAYLSLHRSEGFGLTLAEAVIAEVPLVATGWSGNMDFCRPDLCFLVDPELVPVQDSHLSFQGLTNAVWAEPSIEHAASQLRSVRSDVPAAQAKAARLRDHLRSHLSAATYQNALAQLAPCGVPSPQAVANHFPRGVRAGP